VETSTESYERDKNIPLHLKVLRKIHICIFAVLISWRLKKNKKLLHRIRLTFPIRFLCFADRRNPQKQDPLKKVGLGQLGGNIRGSKSVG